MGGLPECDFSHNNRNICAYQAILYICIPCAQEIITLAQKNFVSFAQQANTLKHKQAKYSKQNTVMSATSMNKDIQKVQQKLDVRKLNNKNVLARILARENSCATNNDGIWKPMAVSCSLNCGVELQLVLIAQTNALVEAYLKCQSSPKRTTINWIAISAEVNSKAPKEEIWNYTNIQCQRKYKHLMCVTHFYVCPY